MLACFEAIDVLHGFLSDPRMDAAALFRLGMLKFCDLSKQVLLPLSASTYTCTFILPPLARFASMSLSVY